MTVRHCHGAGDIRAVERAVYLNVGIGARRHGVIPRDQCAVRLQMQIKIRAR